MARIKNIEFYNFRNFKSYKTLFDNKLNILFGDNGCGKTNILEGISLISKGRGIRNANIANLIKKDQDNFFIKNNLEIEKNILFLILTVCIATDIGGFIFGKIFKGKKLSIVSPNKTYSGMIGSFIFSLIFGFVIFNQIFSNEFLILYIILISILSQAGDLLISLFKRKANMKDTGAVLPGHGGLLDRIDGLLLALPLSIFLFKIL